MNSSIFKRKRAFVISFFLLVGALMPLTIQAQERRAQNEGSNLKSKSLEQRNEISFLRGKYNIAQYKRHRNTFRYSAAMHYQHGKQHDVLQLTPLKDHEKEDADFNQKSVEFVYQKKAKTEPTMELFGLYTARFAYSVYRTIDWTHAHHEQTYDIMSDDDVAWNEKKRYTDRRRRRR